MSGSPISSTLESSKSSRTEAASDVLLIKTPRVRTPPPPPDDANTLLLLGALQMLLGVLMSVFGVLTLVHAASMSTVGAGLWGGAVSVVTGVVMFLTGLKTNQVTLTASLALNLVSLAVNNLVVVMAGTGVLRDYYKMDSFEVPLLAGYALLVVATADCVVVLWSGYRCYRRIICPCAVGGTGGARPGTAPAYPSGSCHSPEPYFSNKDQLIADWLVQNPQRPKNILLVPQAAIHGHFSPIYTLPSPPISSLGHPSVCSHDRSWSSMQRRYGQPVYMRRHRQYSPMRKVRQPSRQEAASRQESASRHKRQRPRKVQRPITDEEVAQTYTGLDRRIAEEFIKIAMEPSMKLPRELSLGSEEEQSWIQDS